MVSGDAPAAALPLVSVVTCFRDAERFLGETIRSVLAQTHEAWELLLVDDGSGDASSGIARDYARRLPERVRVFEHPGRRNEGCSVSRNLAIRHARGEYLAILDSDDLLLPRALEGRVAVLQSRPDVGMLYGPALLWHGWTGEPADRARDREERLHLPAGTEFRPPSFSAYLLDYDAAIPSPCAVLLRRSVVGGVGGFEDSFRDLFDDQVLFVKLGLESTVLVTGECDSKYRQHPGSTCAIADREGRTDAARLLYLDWVRQHLEKQTTRDERVWKALDELTFRFRRPRLFSLARGAQRLADRLRARLSPRRPRARSDRERRA
jgi:glycosyltransferase involved in cell wall biosynthesis